MAKKFNLKTGKLGEDMAENFLKRKGYQIIARNFKTKYSEIDLIAEKDKVLIFVEVKTRAGDGFGSPEEAINQEKRKRLKRAAQAFVAFHHWEGSSRIDAICIVLDKEGEITQFRHHENIN